MERDDVIMALAMAFDAEEANQIIEDEIGGVSTEDKIEYLLDLFENDETLVRIVKHNLTEPYDVVYDELLNTVILF